jgi:hypothetical protein
MLFATIPAAAIGQSTPFHENPTITAVLPADTVPATLNFAISGGVSLGSYEAGLLWTMLAALRITRKWVIAIDQLDGRPSKSLLALTGQRDGVLQRRGHPFLTTCMDAIQKPRAADQSSKE